MPLPPQAELQWWYQYYFATKRGLAGYETHRRDFAKLIWQTASPMWSFGEATFERSAAALDNSDHVQVVIHNYRWRLGLAEGEPRYDNLEQRLAKAPIIRVPTITLEADANGAHTLTEELIQRCFLESMSIALSREASGTICPRRRQAHLRKPCFGRRALPEQMTFQRSNSEMNNWRDRDGFGRPLRWLIAPVVGALAGFVYALIFNVDPSHSAIRGVHRNSHPAVRAWDNLAPMAARSSSSRDAGVYRGDDCDLRGDDSGGQRRCRHGPSSSARLYE